MVIPNIVGVDIGCGVLTTIFKATTPIDFKKLDDFIIENIPSGMSVRNGKHSKLNDNVKQEIKEIVEKIDNATVDDIQKIAQEIFSSDPTYTLLGAVDKHMEYDELQKALS